MRYFLAFLICPAIFAAEVTQQDVKMPGDNSFGFFHTPGYCRIRTQPKCNFLVAGTKMRSQMVEIRIKNNFLRARTDDTGVFDAKFKCPESLLQETVTLITAGFVTKFKLKDAPKKINVPENICPVELPF